MFARVFGYYVLQLPSLFELDYAVRITFHHLDVAFTISADAMP